MLMVGQMEEIGAGQLKRTVESRLGGLAKFVQSVPVRETGRRWTEHDGAIYITEETLWDGVVHIFDLTGHAKAKRAYAWCAHNDGKRRLHSVLHLGPVTGPVEAVRAIILVDQEQHTEIRAKAHPRRRPRRSRPSPTE